MQSVEENTEWWMKTKPQTNNLTKAWEGEKRKSLKMRPLK